MHLAIVGPYPPTIGGISQYGYHVSRALANSGAFGQVTVLTNEVSQPGPVVVPANLTVERVWRADRLDASSRIAVRLRQLHPDIVWFNLGMTVFGRSLLPNVAGLLGPAMVRRLGLPCLLTMHEMVELANLRLLKAPGWPLSSLGARWITGIVARADVVCVTLRRYADWLESRRPEIPCVHIPIGPCGTPEALDESASPELLSFTTLAPFKGLELLLEAFRQLRVRIPRATLTIAGAEHVRFPGYLAHLRQEFGGLAAVRWLGYVPEENVREVFRRCQVVALPYTAATGSSSVLYQAVTWGRPVVASDLPELCATVEEAGLDAEFFPSGNVGGLIDALERLLSSPELRKRQVERNRRALYRLSPDNICRSYLEAFNLCLQLHNSGKSIPIPPTKTQGAA